MYLNKTFIAGNLTRDPEMKAMPSGGSVCNFSIATSRSWTDKATGEKKEQTDYHNIVVFGRQAESVGQYLKKGSGALVEGRLQTRSWEKDGVKQYKTEVVADNVQFGAKPTGGGMSISQNSTTGDNSVTAQVGTINYPTEDINPEDIPF